MKASELIASSFLVWRATWGVGKKLLETAPIGVSRGNICPKLNPLT